MFDMEDCFDQQIQCLKDFGFGLAARSNKQPRLFEMVAHAGVVCLHAFPPLSMVSAAGLAMKGFRIASPKMTILAFGHAMAECGDNGRTE